MINGNLEQFLDTGWFTEATLFYKGYTYWCEGYWKEGIMSFTVKKYKSNVVKGTYTKRQIENNSVVDYSVPFSCEGKTEDEVREKFLLAKIFDEKSFWEVEKEIAWYDEF